MIIRNLATAPDKIIEAYKHIKALHPQVTFVAFNEDFQWTFGTVDGELPVFTGSEDINLLNAAADAQYADPTPIPVVYLETTDAGTVSMFVEHISTWHANVVKRLQSILAIPESEAITVTDNDSGTSRVISDSAEKNLFISGVMCALTEFVNLPIEQLDKVDNSAEQSEQEA